MKICAVIAEYNPFHNGHLKHLEYIKNSVGADKIIVIMSGNFTQRGEGAVKDKFTRAVWAINGGADMVIELPTVFATSNAELFASGAVKILNDLHSVDVLCFGVESGTEDDYLNTAKTLLNESEDFKFNLKKELSKGLSFVKAKFNAVKELKEPSADSTLLSSPNNVLGLEYAKAKLKFNSDMALFPINRFGESEHNDKKIKAKISSARSIREAINGGKIRKVKGLVPTYVYKDLPKSLYDFSTPVLTKLYVTSAKDLKEITDCTEGLENRIKALSKDNYEFNGLVEKIATKRYTYARVKRILINNLLNVKQKLVFKALASPLYAKVLAVKEDSKDLIPFVMKNATIPVLTRKKDYDLVEKTAKEVLEIDELASDVYALVSKEKQNHYQMLIVK